MTTRARCVGRRPVDALLVATAIALTACASSDSDEPRPARQQQGDGPSTAAAGDPSSKASPTSFESAQHHYRIEVPAGWTFVEGVGTWARLDQFVPGAEVPGEDLVTSATSSGFLVANSMRLPEGITPQAWLAELDELVGSGPSPDCHEQRTTAVVAGEQATVVRHRCKDKTLVGSSLIHGDRGYYFTIGYPTGDAAIESTLEELASSVRFIG